MCLIFRESSTICIFLYFKVKKYTKKFKIKKPKIIKIQIYTQNSVKSINTQKKYFQITKK